MSKYLTFSEVPQPVDRKTKVVWVLSASGGVKLGTIKWYGAWRQYTFHPGADTIFNTECMADISCKINDLMREWRATKEQAEA